MWEFTSGIPPYNNKPHDYHLYIDICKGERPEIIENTPQCYIDLMKRCWDSDPENRPTVTELEYKMSEWIRCTNEFYRVNRNGFYNCRVSDIDIKLENDMLEFVKENNALVQEQANITITQPHSQAYYTSRKLTEILVKEDSGCLECIVENY
ncbi:kinase-like domain-containing protein [Rhizophagus clarus]|nr:kinase-like domain-containing protein [Rhizophagus clarus]